MAWTRTTSLTISLILLILGVILIVLGANKENVGIAVSGVVTIVLSAILYFALTPESYEDTKNSPMHAKIPNLRVESALDNQNQSLIIANRCNSIYGGAWQMGAESDCGRVKQNPNGF